MALQHGHPPRWQHVDRQAYPGVRWRKDTQTWRVQFAHKGKRISLGSYQTEEAAARVHDDYVRANGLPRPLHFPREGELSSGSYRENLEARAGKR